jgi:hypothetical protein
MTVSNYDKEVSRRLLRILELEFSSLYGLAETISHNLDYIFRYLFIIAYLLMVSSMFTFQYHNSNGFSFLGACICISLIFFIALFVTMIQYRKKSTNIDICRSLLFYIRCRCFKAKQILENYE